MRYEIAGLPALFLCFSFFIINFTNLSCLISHVLSLIAHISCLSSVHKMLITGRRLLRCVKKIKKN